MRDIVGAAFLANAKLVPLILPKVSRIVVRRRQNAKCIFSLFTRELDCKIRIDGSMEHAAFLRECLQMKGFM